MLSPTAPAREVYQCMGGLARIPSPLFYLASPCISHPLASRIPCGRPASRLRYRRALWRTGASHSALPLLQWSLRETSSPPGAVRHWRTRQPNHALRGCGSGSIPRSTCRGAFPRARARRAAPMATIRPHQGRRGAGPRTCARCSGLGPHVARSRARCRCCPCLSLESPPKPIAELAPCSCPPGVPCCGSGFYLCHPTAGDTNLPCCSTKSHAL